MSNAWEVKLEDIETVLEAHGSDANPQDVFDDFDDVLRVEKAILWYTNFDQQCAAADDEIEDILIEKGIIGRPKLFSMPKG